MGVKERLARLEAEVARLAARRGPGDVAAGEEGPAAAAPSLGSRLHGWLSREAGGERIVVVAGVARRGGCATRTAAWDAGSEPFPFDARVMAGRCQALASESRIAILRQLLPGRSGTAELMGATGLDRGQLYHHLRDLFVQGWVRQPERGLYELMGAGLEALAMAGMLSMRSDGEAAGLPLEDGAGA